MKIAVISDQHLGFGWDTERADDPFENLTEALDRAADADLILLPGDLFDRKRPRQAVLARAIDCFRRLEDQETALEIDDGPAASFRGTPMVAIHGTHERRTGDHVNPVELFERMGFLVHLHGDHVVFRHRETGERVAVHGMSGVPERYAPDVLEKHGYEPIEDCYNIFMLHQSIRNMVYTDADQSVLEIGMLPTGFDAIIDGHIHWYNLDHRDDERPLVLPGSTVTTQLNQVEAERPKGFLMIDTAADSIEFIELESPRTVVHETVDVTGMTGSEVRDRVEAIADDAAADEDRRPLLRVRLRGETDADISLTELRQALEDRTLPSLSKDITAPTADEDQDEIEVSEDSADEMGRELLEHEVGGAVGELFDRFVESGTDEALAALEEMDPDRLRPDAETAESEDSEDRTPNTDGAEQQDEDQDDSDAADETDETDQDPTIRRFTEL